MMIGAAKLYILILVWMTFTFIQGHNCMKNQQLLCPFSQKFYRRLCFNNLLVKSFIYFAQVIFKGKNFADMIFVCVCVCV